MSVRERMIESRPGIGARLLPDLAGPLVRLLTRGLKHGRLVVVTPAGSRVELELTSRDVEHGFEIPGTDTKVTIPPRGGGSVTVVVHAEKTGKIRFRCARPCGAGHAEMAGVIVVK